MNPFYFIFHPSACASVCGRRKFSFCQVVHPSAHYTTLILFCQLHFRLPFFLPPSLFPIKENAAAGSSNLFLRFYIKFLRIFAYFCVKLHNFLNFFLPLRDNFYFYAIIHDVKKYVQYGFMYIRIYGFTYFLFNVNVFRGAKNESVFIKCKSSSRK